MGITNFKLTTKAYGCLCSVLLILISNSYLTTAYATQISDQELGPWSAMLYRCNTAQRNFGDVMLGKYNSYGEEIYVAELAYTLDQKNLIRKLFKPIFDTVQIAGNVAYRHDYTNQDNVKEGNLYLIWRWTKFPWEKYLKNSIAIGDGFSYASHPPFADRRGDRPASDFARFLNYLMVEITFAVPPYPQFQFAIRVHHRCTAWGTFSKNANAGSTSIGVGIRYYF